MSPTRTGGSRRAALYEMPSPRSFGDGIWPHQTFDGIADVKIRQMCEWWSDLVFEMRTRRSALGLTQAEAAKKADVALNTYEAIERGDAWGTVPTLLKVVFALGLRLEQTVEVRSRRGESS